MLSLLSTAAPLLPTPAEPRRVVKHVDFVQNKDWKKFYIEFQFDQIVVGKRNKKHRKPTKDSDAIDDPEDAVRSFFRRLRFCNVTGGIKLDGLHVDQFFLRELKAAAMSFRFKDTKLFLADVSIANDIDAVDVLCSFPSFRNLNGTTQKFLQDHVGQGDVLLRTLATRGKWLLGRECLYAPSHLTETGVLDYLFGDYKDDVGGRRLALMEPDFSKEFVGKLVKACRQSRSRHRIDLRIYQKSDMNIDDVALYGKMEVNANDSSVWHFRFDDLPRFRMTYKQQSLRVLRCSGEVGPIVSSGFGSALALAVHDQLPQLL